MVATRAALGARMDGRVEVVPMINVVNDARLQTRWRDALAEGERANARGDVVQKWGTFDLKEMSLNLDAYFVAEVDGSRDAYRAGLRDGASAALKATSAALKDTLTARRDFYKGPLGKKTGVYYQEKDAYDDLQTLEEDSTSTRGRPRRARSALLKMREAAAVVLMRLVSPLLAKPKKSKLSTPRVQKHHARKEDRRRKRLAQVEACTKKRRRAAPAAASAASAENSSAPAPLQCPICLEDLDDAPALACGHQFHAACVQELAATAWANGARRTRDRGTAVLCPLCRAQSYVQ